MYQLRMAKRAAPLDAQAHIVARGSLNGGSLNGGGCESSGAVWSSLSCRMQTNQSREYEKYFLNPNQLSASTGFAGRPKHLQGSLRQSQASSTQGRPGSARWHLNTPKASLLHMLNRWMCGFGCLLMFLKCSLSGTEAAVPEGTAKLVIATLAWPPGDSPMACPFGRHVSGLPS